MLHDFCRLSLPPALQNFTDMICFILKFFVVCFISVSGSVIWDCHTQQEKNQKTNLRERKWKTCPSVFLYLMCGFFIIKFLGCKQMSGRSCQLNWVLFRRGIGQGGVLFCLPRQHIWKVWAEAGVWDTKEKCDGGSDMLLIPHSAGCCSRRILLKRCSNRLSYFWLIQLFVAVFVFDFELVWTKTQKLEWSGAPVKLFDQPEIFLKEGADY